jgi:hypothetical protein
MRSQDNIITKNGDEIKSKVIKIGSTEIEYKKLENLNGPAYSILKSEVFMIKYENGTKDIINPITQDSKNEKIIENESKDLLSKPEKNIKYNYIEKVREIQKNDPSFSIYFGNGWLAGPGISNPVIGADIRFPRKNIFIRGISIGIRASFKNIAGDGDTYINNTNYETLISRAIYGFGIVFKYHAPIPIKVFQPYFIAKVGGAQFDEINKTAYNGVGYTTGWVGTSTNEILPYGGVGLGCNFMLGKRFGAFIELGRFTTSFLNTGFVIKL